MGSILIIIIVLNHSSTYWAQIPRPELLQFCSALFSINILISITFRRDCFLCHSQQGINNCFLMYTNTFHFPLFQELPF